MCSRCSLATPKPQRFDGCVAERPPSAVSYPDQGCGWHCRGAGLTLLEVRRVLNSGFRRRLAVAATVVALAVGLAGVSQPGHVEPAPGGSVTSTHSVAITEVSALDSTFTERRPSQRSDLFLLAVLFAAVVWVVPRGQEALPACGPSSASSGRLLLVRDRGPPSFA